MSEIKKITNIIYIEDYIEKQNSKNDIETTEDSDWYENEDEW